MHKFVENIIAFALRNHILILFLTTLLFVAGIVCYIHTPIEAYPDVTNTRVRIITQWPGRSAEEVEKFVTLPIMKEMNTIPRKTDVRSTSLFGLSVVTVIFEDGVDDFFAQQYSSNRMQDLDLPEGTDPSIEPPSGATGEIYRYVLKSDLPIREVAAINEWVVERELLSVPGVASIASFGGEEKMFEIKVNPAELNNYNLSPLEVYEAVSKSNINVGGDIIQKGSQAYVVRGIGLLESLEDIENILIEVKGGTPIRVKQVATVDVSSKPRLGQVGLDDEDDVVQGIVIMLRGQNPSEVIGHLKEKITELNDRILPENVKIEPFLDRTTLVDSTVHTVMRNLLEGIILVSIVVFVFLFNWRTTVIVATVIPLSFLFAIIMLRIQGLPANLISMGALDFGLLLEGTLVIVEIIFVAMEKRSKELGQRFTKISKSGLIKKSAGSVASHIFFAQVILVVALFPIFSFQKVEGKMFSPLAFTLGYALLGSLILSLTYVPVMCKILLNKPVEEKTNFISRFFTSALHKVYLFSSRYRKGAIITFCLLLTVCVVRMCFWGTEFIPSMNEGAIYIRATLPNSVNLDESVRTTKEMKQKLRRFDEIEFILSQTGRPNDGTDATGFFNIEFHAQLKPEKEWKRKIKKDELLAEIKDSLDIYPGIILAFSQPIQDNVEEYVAGVKSSLVIKIFGSDLSQMEGLADQTAAAIKNVRGVEDVNVFRSVGLPELQIKLEESRMARYAVSMADAQAVVEMAIGGKAATTFYEGERTFDVQIRFQKEYRDNEDKIGNILIPTMDGKYVPLKEIADIRFITGPTFIYREGSSRYVGIGFSIRDRDLGSTIAEAQKKVSESVTLKTENKMVWAGEFESQQRATARLAVIIPAVLLLILFLLYLNFGTVKDTLIAASAIPYAFIGGFISLWVTGTVFGISAGIGFIILFGITAIDSILLITLMKTRMQRTRNLRLAIDDAVKSRIRPVLMIALMGSMGLFPAALSQGMGSEIQRPLAIMIVGGILICMILSFTVLPQVFYFAYRRDKRLKDK
ncbi:MULTISPECIES: CusA/CzcA family heavy metal efflux RND transporter [unclassified Dysgonomonas]|jgi:cobalt-zinc-cadmium resistance protein CzcA|uniref:efflux RND transporter permease subunit n=1 Tax=unclassified Dysgonomonas TaxID=2630389 RepID=UPI0025C0E175|nr:MULTISPECIES: CusA/CzcA family heavy metal efflux RND transporter [unclassified Dysgonomonas]MDR2002196.1 CusA/CzcA family heavy metal efflux RND transporter [Prevotella sp.]HMM03393.1 CusA/CzcA family heavy metal efflux RND transporter [Dysgonomonas sp.]